MEPTLSCLITSAEQGDASAAKALFASLYAELHRLAKREIASRGGGGTLSATTLLHEAYLNMSRREGVAFPDRARFMGYAARVMRGVIVDYARERHAKKRGGEFELTSLGTEVANVADAAELSAIAEALDELANIEPRLAQVVELKYFCGFSFVEIAGMRGVSERTVQRDWDKARIYLQNALEGDSRRP